MAEGTGQDGGQNNQNGSGQGGSGSGTPPPWHQGLDAETIGHIQNRGLKLDDPKAVVDNLAKAHREATSKLGVPPDQLLRMIKPDSPPADIKTFWARLGAPDKPDGYDFAAIKFADGADLDAPFVESMRAAFDAAHLPKDAAASVTKAFVKFMDDAEASETAAVTAQRRIEGAELQKEWGRDFDGNLFIAKRGAELLGLKKEQIDALENVAGWGAIMRAFHKVGVLNKEDRFVTGGNNQGTMTREQATARLSDLKKDQAWVNRYMNGDVTAKQEMENLQRIMVGYFEAA